MSIVKPRGLSRNDQPAEIEGNIRELVRRESGAIRQPGDISEQATDDLSSLVHRVSGESTREIDYLIDGLKGLRKKLDDDGRTRSTRDRGIFILEPISNSAHKDHLGRHDPRQNSGGCSDHRRGGAQFSGREPRRTNLKYRDSPQPARVEFDRFERSGWQRFELLTAPLIGAWNTTRLPRCAQ